MVIEKMWESNRSTAFYRFLSRLFLVIASLGLGLRLRSINAFHVKTLVRPFDFDIPYYPLFQTYNLITICGFLIVRFLELKYTS